MNKEQKVISLELAKELQRVAKENGFELPESEYWWEKEVGNNYGWHITQGHIDWADNSEGEHCFRAYDTSELGEALSKYGCYGSWETKENKWAITELFSQEFPELDSETEAEVRGKMLVLLIRNGMIKT